MSYPGNSSLARETQEKILSTFSQTLDLASKGRLQEAALGCDFILKMDRMFEPARALQTRLQGASGSVEVADLNPAPATAPAPAGGSQGDDAFVLELSDEEEPLPSLDGVGSLEEEPVPLLELPTEPGGAATASPAAALPAAAPPAAAAEEPVPGLGAATSDNRIAELLQEGQAAFEQTEYQSAIDAWSRIFLIDIDHTEATQLIESARQLKAEQERQIDELMHEATTLRGEGKTEEARAVFTRVLELHPSHLAAKEYLLTLDQSVAQEAPAVTSYKPPPAAAPAETGVFSGELPSLEQLSGVLEVPGEEVSSVSTQIQGRGGSVRPDRAFLRIGLPVFVLLLVAGWLIYANWGRIFQNTSEPVPEPPAPNVVQLANRVHLDGNTADAIVRLQQIAEGSPEYDRAQLLIERWTEDLAEVEANDVAAATGPGEEEVARQEALLERARRLYDEREYLESAKAFQAAGKVIPLEGASADLYEDTKLQLLPIASQIALFRQRQWEMVLSTMWRRLGEDPTNRDVVRLLASSYYNLGVRELRRGEPAVAASYFREIIGLGRPDPFAERLLLLSETYIQYPEDLLYRIYVRQLKYRR